MPVSSSKDQFEFSTFEQKLPEIKTRLQEDFKLGMLLIDTSGIRNIEYEHGKTVYDQILNSLKSVIQELQQKKQLRQDDILTLNSLDGDIFYIFLSKQRNEGKFLIADFEALSARIENFINQRMMPVIYPVIRERPRINMGYAITFFNPSLKANRILQSLVSDAEQMARYQEIKNRMVQKEAVYSLIIDQLINIIFQPVFDLLNQTIIGYEAFSHGPAGSEYENPTMLFSIAREIGLLYELDWLCKMQSFKAAGDFSPGQKLFVNIFSSSISHAQLRLQSMSDLLANTNLQHHDVVFELSDKLALENFQFLNEIIEQYAGEFNLAVKIDDSWGISDLAMIKNLKVRYIKLGKSLTRELHNNTVNLDIVLSLRDIARGMQTDLIAEGIQNEGELKALVRAGVRLGQGFLLTEEGQAAAAASLAELYMQEDVLKNMLLSSIYSKRGVDYFTRGLYDQAILEFSKAIEINREDVDTLFHRAQAYFEDGAYGIALTELKKVIELNIDYALAYFSMGLVYEKTGQTDNAILAYKQYIKSAPAVSQTNIELAKQKLKKLSGSQPGE